VVTARITRRRVSSVVDAGSGASVVAGELIINDAGFGSKPTAAAYFLSAFESSAVGDTALEAGLDNLGSDGTMPLVADDRAFYGTKSLKCIYPTGEGGEAFPRIGKTISPGATDSYHSCMVYWDIITGSISVPIFKWGRAGCNATYSGQPQYHDTIRPNASGVVIAQDTGCVAGGVDMYDATTVGESGVVKSPTKGAWHFVEYIWRLSTAGGTDGLFERYIDGVETIGGQLWFGENDPVTGFPTRESGNSSYGNGNRFDMWADRIAIDTSLARCVVTNNAVYPSSTLFAYQEAAEWVANQIRAPFTNPGIASAATAYAHVWGTDGEYVGNYDFVVP
jgi:hypothetical protein